MWRMKPPRRSREKLAEIALQAASARRRPDGGTPVVSFRHDHFCPLLAGRDYCQCNVEVVVSEVPRR